ncbi:hypothetical protein B0H11DRAFT_1907890 [Mycena galericulata]|nr:hypothetical protein B0H11DRAFT_1907890 [Mycena galericulata]
MAPTQVNGMSSSPATDTFFHQTFGTLSKVQTEPLSQSNLGQIWVTQPVFDAVPPIVLHVQVFFNKALEKMSKLNHIFKSPNHSMAVRRPVDGHGRCFDGTWTGTVRHATAVISTIKTKDRFRRVRPSKMQSKSPMEWVGYPSHGTCRTGTTGTVVDVTGTLDGPTERETDGQKIERGFEILTDFGRTDVTDSIGNQGEGDEVKRRRAIPYKRCGQKEDAARHQTVGFSDDRKDQLLKMVINGTSDLTLQEIEMLPHFGG